MARRTDGKILRMGAVCLAVLLVAGAVVFSEDALFVGFVIPGETAAVLGGVAVSLGHASLAVMMVTVVAGAIIGDSVGYEVGRHLGPRLVAGRMLRNRRSLFFALVFPSLMYFIFGSGSQGAEKLGGSAAEGSNVSAYVMVSMALYGGALIAASTGAGVAVERALGWSRQLRLTPLNPGVYIVIKAGVALVMGAAAIAVVNLVGAIQGKPEMPLI